MLFRDCFMYQLPCFMRHISAVLSNTMSMCGLQESKMLRIGLAVGVAVAAAYTPLLKPLTGVKNMGGGRHAGDSASGRSHCRWHGAHSCQYYKP